MFIETSVPKFVETNVKMFTKNQRIIISNNADPPKKGRKIMNQNYFIYNKNVMWHYIARGFLDHREIYTPKFNTE